MPDVFHATQLIQTINYYPPQATHLSYYPTNTNLNTRLSYYPANTKH